MVRYITGNSTLNVEVVYTRTLDSVYIVTRGHCVSTLIYNVEN